MSNKPDAEFIVPTLETGVYVHYKSPEMRYEVLGVGFDTETNEPMVIYKPLYESSVPLWVRPYEMFVSSVVVNGIEQPRFKKSDE